MAAAAEAAGLPKGMIGCLTELTLQGTNELMNHYATSMIVRPLADRAWSRLRIAAASRRSVWVRATSRSIETVRLISSVPPRYLIVESKSFDCSTICATEQCVIADRPIAERLKAEMQARSTSG